MRGKPTAEEYARLSKTSTMTDRHEVTLCKALKRALANLYVAGFTEDEIRAYLPEKLNTSPYDYRRRDYTACPVEDDANLW